MTYNSDPVPYSSYDNNDDPNTVSQTKYLLCYPNVRMEASHLVGLSRHAHFASGGWLLRV
jgi:hypothetical protein